MLVLETAGPSCHGPGVGAGAEQEGRMQCDLGTDRLLDRDLDARQKDESTLVVQLSFGQPASFPLAWQATAGFGPPALSGIRG